MADKKITYKNSGVNIDEGNLFVKKIQPFVKSTATKNILNGTSSFAALYKLNINKIKNRNDKAVFKHQLDKLWVHGLVHLFGYDHKKNRDFLKMKNVEKKFLSYLKND